MAGRLSRASTIAPVALALLATSAFATEPDRVCTRETVGRTPALATLQSTIDTMFAVPSAPSVVTEDGVTGMSDTVEMLVVRVKDGKPVLACVNTKEAAKRFLAAPLDQIGGKAAAEK